jgi:hypothetical protein
MKKPDALSPLADKVLQELAARPEAAEIVLGGYVALQHHVDYRQTHDVDAWWRARASPEAESAIVDAMRNVAAGEGFQVRQRRFGETLSIEFLRHGRKRFSFQISVRSVALEPPLTSPWPPILIETLADNVASKMTALVDRGSPRDFLDVKTVVQRGLMPVEQCWRLWSRKNPGQSIESAKQNVLLHLGALEARRPLRSIADPSDREQARLTRDWFRREFMES